MEKYSTEAQKIISISENLAFNFGHSLVSSDHLLLSLAKHDNILSRELKKNKITYDLIYKKVQSLFPTHDTDPLYMEYTFELKRIIDNASLISKQYHENNISVNALIVSLLSEKNSACSILQKLKIDTSKLCQIIQNNIVKKSELDSISDLHKLSEVEHDPLIGRENELLQLINALSRRNKPNAILVGEPGVGKTAIVEELARLLKENKVPKLKNKSIYELDLASTVGGTKYRGEFEEKIKKIIKKVIEDGNCILFIDEIHNIIKAGGAEGAIDASNILKPYLSRNQIQVIGATTEDEFQTIFEKDKALKRRFQVIKMEPSTLIETKQILLHNKSLYEKHYDITISDELLSYIVDITSLYLPNLFFPDKALDVLDNSCVIAKNKLTKLDINKTIETYYKINVNLSSKREVVLNKIKEKISGQETAIEKIMNSLSLIDHAIYDKDKPILNLLFLGPSGVGKTEISKIIGEVYFSKENIIYLDMSSYQELNAINKLIGFSSQDNNTKLVRELKSHPKSLIILDEIEKANTEVLDFFLQIFDQGFFDSIKGERIDCRNAMIIMTSNYGFDNDLNFRMNIDKEKINEEFILKKLQNKFRFEFLSRIDDIIIFDFLNENTKNTIAQNYLKSLPLTFEISDFNDVLIHTDEEYNKYGARLIKRDCKRAILKKFKEKQKN